MNDNIKNYLNDLALFTETEIEVITSLFKNLHLKKNEYFAKEGEYSTKVAFLTNGVLRAFYRSKDGNEYNKTFFCEYGFFGAYSSLITNQKNIINIQCLTDCQFLTADFSKFIKLYDSIPRVERLSRILAEQFFIIKEKREIELVTLDASERYKIFRKEHPNLENLISQYHIASYLGVSATQLSRIRAKK